MKRISVSTVLLLIAVSISAKDQSLSDLNVTSGSGSHGPSYFIEGEKFYSR